jgi:two-component system, cell cycle sensor histidine kinase and response regulator CckA
MANQLRVLQVEDNEDDALLIVRELRRGGYEVVQRRVMGADEMRQALAEEQWDLVISDYSLPTFSGPAALSVLKQSGCDIPFIMVSGTIDEQTAVTALHAGAHDFVLKTRLARLLPAVQRELNDAATRRAQRAGEEEVKRLEEQVRHAQKMEAVGRLAGGIAHDFNNILTAIIATADLALDTPELPDELRADLESILDSGRRAAAITRQLLTFSRKQVVQPRPIDLNEVVQNSEPLLRRLVNQAIRLEMDLVCSGVVEADPTQVEQVLLNLVVNASDATPAGGVISVSTSDITTHAAAQYDGVALPPGRYAVLRVRDTGSGMDAATLERIYEPFFTTKEAGRGTGLGLATVYGIVNQSGGHIFVHSQPGEGTQFEILLPCIDSAPAPDAGPITKRGSVSGSEVILVVEDEPAVRAPVCRSLRQLGYFVLEADHGEDALRVLHEYHAPIHLLITDVVMPEMTGAQLVRLLHDWYPQLKVLFISGYSEQLVSSDVLVSEGVAYMPKPFTPEELAQRVRQLLDEPRPDARLNQLSV